MKGCLCITFSTIVQLDLIRLLVQWLGQVRRGPNVLAIRSLFRLGPYELADAAESFRKLNYGINRGGALIGGMKLASPLRTAPSLGYHMNPFC